MLMHQMAVFVVSLCLLWSNDILLVTDWPIILWWHAQVPLLPPVLFILSTK